MSKENVPIARDRNKHRVKKKYVYGFLVGQVYCNSKVYAKIDMGIKYSRIETGSANLGVDIAQD